MTPQERLEFKQMKDELNKLRRAFSIEDNRIIFGKPIIVRGTATINGITIFTGSGTPEGNVTANIGSMYLRLNGTSANTLYVKEAGTGNTGWSTTA